MTRELFWLTLTVILTGLLWIPYVLNRTQVRGLAGTLANPMRGDKPHAEWANRLMFAHDNAVENLIIFAPLVLILNTIDYSSPATVLACAVELSCTVQCDTTAFPPRSALSVALPPPKRGSSRQSP